MPRTPSLTKKEVARLAGLPRIPNLNLEGGMRSLPLYVREGTETFQPRMVMWVDSAQGFIRGTELIASPRGDGIDEALHALLAAMGDPVPSPPQDVVDGLLAITGTPQKRQHLQGPQPGLPATVRIDDRAVATAASALLAPLNIAVDYAEHVPALDEAFAAMAASMGVDPAAGPPAPFTWTLDSALLPPLYKAAAGYARRAPWTYMPDYPPLAVDLGEYGPQDDVRTLYACILGGGGEVMGVALYYSLDAVRQAALQGIDLVEQDEELAAAVDLLQHAGGPLAELPDRDMRDLAANLLDQKHPVADTVVDELSDALLMFLDTPEETDPSYLDWVAAQGVKLSPRQSVPMFFRTSPGGAPQPPSEREVMALTMAVEALNRFFTQYGEVLAGPLLPADTLSHTARISTPTGKATVEVTFPPSGTTWEEWEDGDDVEDAPDLPVTAATTLYRFQVKLHWQKSIWRRIELRGDQTLHDLHLAIQRAFEWDNDHLYAFFLSGKAWDSTTEYASPYGNGPRPANHARLAQLPLAAGKQFLYIFDFGDELRHLVKLEAITPEGVQQGMQYPRIAESHGDSVPQYPDLEEE